MSFKSKKGFVPALTQDTFFWIGLKLEGTCDSFSGQKYWLDGSALDFENWTQIYAFSCDWKGAFIIRSSDDFEAGRWMGRVDTYEFPFMCQTKNILYCPEHVN
ncbi:hypothetical protein NECAME_17483 [Necator americanus]|uniref:C-type lectin domain-containing protein n=1 Tax=Necator americanus TaxID=51031 RepID=W2TNW4_NECAM|nr:hypothetical protein NECAME_17483 [Necator americanus]ETN83369.1 hypothetical protein NECAME_17483 [Necator americanus]